MFRLPYVNLHQLQLTDKLIQQNKIDNDRKRIQEKRRDNKCQEFCNITIVQRAMHTILLTGACQSHAISVMHVWVDTSIWMEPVSSADTLPMCNKPFQFGLEAVQFGLEAVQFGLEAVQFGLEAVQFGLEAVRRELKASVCWSKPVNMYFLSHDIPHILY